MSPVLQFNNSIVAQYARGEVDEYKNFWSDARNQEIAQSYLDLCGLFQSFGPGDKTPIIDRTGTLPEFLRVKNISPLPTSWADYPSYDDICELQAQRMLATNRHIFVYWSGGTDSTLILCALLAGGAKSDQVTVVLSSKSIDEYEWFFLNIIHKRLGYKLSVHTHPFNHDVFTSEDIVTTGELAEPLLHHGRLAQSVPDQPYAGFVPESIREFVDPLVKKCPFEITTLYEFSWWIRFVMFWQSFKCMAYTYLPRKPYDVMHFFDCLEFQVWSLGNHRVEGHLDQNPRDFKPYNKKIITQFTGDADFWLKPKVASLRYRRKPWSYVLEDFSVVGDGTDSWD